ncbi:MAG: hypothetical protein ABIQ40_16995 [Bacteroidia bacterium]
MQRSFLILLFVIIACTCFCQDGNEPGSWTTQIGYTRQHRAHDDTAALRWTYMNGYDVRFISPNFKIETDDEYWTEEKEKKPEDFERARFFCEFMLAPKHRVDGLTDVTELVINADLIYSILHIRRFNLYAEGGLKTFFRYSNNYGLVNFKKVYYWDYGATAQLDLGYVVPFIELRRYRYCTAGIELRLHPVYKKPKRKYHLHNKRRPVY